MGKFGALPPPGIEWQMGKTAASICFVNDAEKYISACQDTNKVNLLRAAIQKVKIGELILQNWLTPEEYLEQHIP